MRVIWHGVVSWGMVTIPVGLTVAQSRQDVSFNQLHRGCGERVKMPKACPTHGELTTDEIVRGWLPEKGAEYVVVEDDELEMLAPDAGRTIAIQQFVSLDEVDPLLFDRTYYLVPAPEPEQRQGYALLRDGLWETGMVAVASFVLWGKQHLSTIRAYEKRLVLDTLFFAEDIRASDELDSMLASVKVSKPEVALAVELIQSKQGDFIHAAYANEHRDRIKAMLADKAKGIKPKPVKAAAAPAPSKDLVESLKKSIAAAQADKKAKAAVAKPKPAKPTKRSSPKAAMLAEKAKAGRTRTRGR